ncbi:(+)-neomenthol dehydrogenase-like [Primulina huaijiensis]|uniref:(+)-neomenthol dehydrogenase-like n=1 Tax=Primulina huaijiensis TaxID=1492673 RepID=UPI003CC6FA41
MAEPIRNLSTNRYAVVTGGNKGIGFEICKQLAARGIHVILTSRDMKRGIEAKEKLDAQFGLSNNVVLHQLDVLDPASIASLVDFITTNHGKLDILVNNAGTAGICIEGDPLVISELVDGNIASVFSDREAEPVELKNGKFIESLEDAKDCIQTNYYGAKRMTEALIPLLQLSHSPRIVNVSSILGNLKLLPNEWAKGILSNAETLTEEKLDQVIEEFLKNFEEGSLQTNRWPTQVAAYKISKASLSAYTRIMAKKYPTFCINCACPGFVQTHMTCNQGPLSVEEGAEGPVNLALLPDGGQSGLFFYQKEVSFF